MTHDISCMLLMTEMRAHNIPGANPRTREWDALHQSLIIGFAFYVEQATARVGSLSNVPTSFIHTCH